MKQGKSLRLVMHIGPHKTATTYLQANFHANAEPLLERGWLYPAIGERVGTAHHDLADHEEQFLQRDGDAYRDFLKTLQKADDTGLDVLLSSEGFRRWKAKHFRAITEIIGKRSLHVVYTLRDPLDSIYSMWAQKASMGPEPSLPEWTERLLRNPLRSNYMNPLIEIRPVLSLPGVGYTVLLYDEIRRQNLDIYSYFLQAALGIDDLTATIPSANERLPIELTEFIRLLAKKSRLPTGRANSRKAVHIGQAVKFLFSLQEKQRIVDTIRDAGTGARRTMTVPRQSESFRTVERRLLRVLREHMHPHPEGNRIFLRRPAEWTYYDEEELLKIPEVQELMRSALAKTRSTYPPLAALNLGKRVLVNWRKLKKKIAF